MLKGQIYTSGSAFKNGLFLNFERVCLNPSIPEDNLELMLPLLAGKLVRQGFLVAGMVENANL